MANGGPAFIYPLSYLDWGKPANFDYYTITSDSTTYPYQVQKVDPQPMTEPKSEIFYQKFIYPEIFTSDSISPNKVVITQPSVNPAPTLKQDKDGGWVDEFIYPIKFLDIPFTIKSEEGCNPAAIRKARIEDALS